MTSRELSGTTAVVTGASRGFGRGIAIALSQAGAQVVGVARDRARLEELCERLGEAFIPVVADATDPVIAGQVLDTYRPRTLVLNAGAAPLARPVHLGAPAADPGYRLGGPLRRRLRRQAGRRRHHLRQGPRAGGAHPGTSRPGHRRAGRRPGPRPGRVLAHRRRPQPSAALNGEISHVPDICRPGRGPEREPGPSLARVRGAGGLVLHDDRGPRDRQRRAADHRPQAAHARIEPAVGRHRLRAHLRRLPAARRPRRGPAGAPPHPDGRSVLVHRVVAGLRAGDSGLLPDPDALPAGARRRDRPASRAVDRDEHVPRGCRAQQGARRVGRYRGERRDRRPDRRRAAHPLRQLAVHLLPQCPGRCGGAAAGPARRARKAGSPRPAGATTRSARPR